MGRTPDFPADGPDIASASTALGARTAKEDAVATDALDAVRSANYEIAEAIAPNRFVSGGITVLTVPVA
jgi:hypothetical protein